MNEQEKRHQRARAAGEVPDSGKVRAALAGVNAVIERLKREEQEGEQRGIGNAQQYVAPIAVPQAKAPPNAREAKVALQTSDVLRALPAGNRRARRRRSEFACPPLERRDVRLLNPRLRRLPLSCLRRCPASTGCNSPERDS